MKKIAVLFLMVSVSLLLAACSVRVTKKASFSVSKSTDADGTSFDYSAEFSTGDVKKLNTDVKDETPDEQDDIISYNVTNGLIHISAPSRDDSWWEIVGDTNTIDVDGWTVQKEIYYGTGKSLIKDGTAYVLIGRYKKGDLENPDRYVIYEVNVEDNNITGVTDEAVVDSLDEYFKD